MKNRSVISKLAHLSSGVVLVAISLGCMESQPVDKSDNDKPGLSNTNNNDSDNEYDTATEDTVPEGFDTGTGIYECTGEFLTAGECFERNGTFDVLLPEIVCEEGQKKQCCLVETLTNPCPYECMYAVECFEREGTPTRFSGHYQCASSSQKCCEGAQEAEQDTEQYMGFPFSPSECPVANAVDSTDQPDTVASEICMELVDDENDWHCPQELYERIAEDISAIKAAFPVIEAGDHRQSTSPSQSNQNPLVSCVAGSNTQNCHDFPKDEWQDLLGCFGMGDVECLLEDHEKGTCGIVFISWDVGINTSLILPYFEEHARSLVSGSSCSLMDKSSMGVAPGNGFTVAGDPAGVLYYHVQVTDDFYAHCKTIILVSTIKNSSTLTEVVVENLSDQQCEDPAFD